MNDPPPPPISPRPARFQFGLWSLLVLTTIVAASLSLVRALDLPPLARVVLAGYAILMGGYLVLRLPFLMRHYRRTLADLERRRDQLRDWTEQRRR